MCTFWQVWVMTSCWRGLPGPGWVPAGGAVSGPGGCRAGCAEEAGKRRDCLMRQCVDAGLLVGGAAGAEFSDGAAVLVLGGELARPGRGGRGRVGHRAAGQGVISPG